jgi:hypothetical protein
MSGAMFGYLFKIWGYVFGYLFRIVGNWPALANCLASYFQWIPLDSYGFLWIPTDFYGFLWMLNPLQHLATFYLFGFFVFGCGGVG